jgi:lipopolysaccharide export system permease protein
MRILDRYILKSVLKIFFGCFITFVFLYVIIDIFSRLDDILKQGVGLNVLKQYYLGFLPIIFVQVAPIACLLATLYTFSKLNHDNEIIAMRSSGLSIPQITRTVVAFGIIMSVLVFWINDRFVPRSLVFTEKIKKQMEMGEKKAKEKETAEVRDIFMYGVKNRLFYINKFTPQTNTIEGITILEHDEKQNVTRKIVANKGVYNNGLWRFYQCITYDFDLSGQVKNEPLYMEEEIMTIPETPEELLAQRQRPDFMTINQLDNYIWKLSKSGATSVIRSLNIDLYKRFIEPFTSIIIILLGIPFSFMIRKRGTGASSLGVSIMLGFLYYVLNAICIALGKAGILAPILSVSLSHILAFTLSLYLVSTLP